MDWLYALRSLSSRTSVSRLIAAMMVLSLGGCAGVAALPGGSEEINDSFYKSRYELLARIDEITPGMAEKDVMAKLGHGAKELQSLKREEIVSALLGSSNFEFRDGIYDASGKNPVQYLYGYRVRYKSVESEHGFTSPIRIRTDKSGFEYSVVLVFREGYLYERPVVSGGVVQESSSKTIFDYLNPGMILDKMP